MKTAIIIQAEDLNSLIKQSVREALSDQPEYSEKRQIRFLNVTEASEFLNLAKQTIYGLTSTRGIPFIKRGKKLYFRKSELEAWLIEGRKKTVKELENEI